MRAVSFDTYGPPSVLHVVDIPEPDVPAGHLLINVTSTAVHPWDVKLRRGDMQNFMKTALPHVPGIDFAGVVRAVADDVSGFAVGDEVFGAGAATYADICVAPAELVALAPPSLTTDERAAVPLGYATATAALDAAEVGVGTHVLVLGGAGGVGMFAVQLAALRGATVTATASTENLHFVQGLGAARGVDHRAPFPADLGAQCNAIVDLVGADAREKALVAAAPGAVVVTIVGNIDADVLAKRGLRTAPVRSVTTRALLESAAKELDAGRLIAEVRTTYPLADAAAAHADVESGHGRGRVILTVTQS